MNEQHKISQVNKIENRIKKIKTVLKLNILQAQLKKTKNRIMKTKLVNTKTKFDKHT